TEEPTMAEVERIIDIYFRSFFTNKSELHDEKKYIFEINPDFKKEVFKNRYKMALIKILFDEHSEYASNKCVIPVPPQIQKNIDSYLQKNCDILIWFKDS